MTKGEYKTVTGRPEYVPALDGMRALAVLAVLVVHTWPRILPGGWVGVDVFFVLSGYLITSLLLSEHSHTGHVALGPFYARRALRLLPAATVAVLVAVALAAVARPDLAIATDHEAVAAAVYLANWQLATQLATSSVPVGMLAHMWSLSIEEQFYVAWPIVLLVLLRLGGRRTALAVALVAVVGIAMHSPSIGGFERPFRTDTRGVSLLVGCALALLVAEGALERVSPRLVRVSALAAIAVLGLIAGSVGSGIAVLAWGYTLIAVASAAVIVAVGVRPTALAGPLASSPLVWLGRRSYGFYLYSAPIYVALVEPRLGVGPAALSVTLGFTLLLAAASFRYLETPFLRLRPRTLRASRNSAGLQLPPDNNKRILAELSTVTTIARHMPGSLRADALALARLGQGLNLDRPGFPGDAETLDSASRPGMKVWE